MASIFSSEPVIAAVLGSALILLVGWYLQNKKEKRISRQAIVGELAEITYESIAALIELHSARTNSNSKAEERKCLARTTKLEGAAMQFEIRIWRFFKERRVRANYHKLINRIDKTKELIMGEEVPPENDVELAFSWIERQFSKVSQFASSTAGIDMRDPARIMFIGLSPRKWRNEIEDLSFDDELPPWVFDIKVNFKKRKIDQDLLKTLTETIKQRAGDMRCQTHGAAAHILIHGRGPENFDFQIEGCCKEFDKAVHTKLCTPRLG